MKRANEDNDGVDLPFLLKGNTTRTAMRPQLQHTIFLTKAIGAPDEYHDELMLLEQAGPEDDVRIIINSPGGRLDSGLMLINGIRGCQAKVTAMIHEAASMATCIALACDNWVLGDFSYFMLHNASYGMIGKHHEIESQGRFMNKYVETFVKTMYSGFLSTQELKKLHGGDDMWIDRDELEQRLIAYGEYRERQAEKKQRAVEREYKNFMKEIKNATTSSSEKAD